MITKTEKMGRTCRVHVGEMKNAYKINWESWREETKWETVA
jgi:hypothetical protein